MVKWFMGYRGFVRLLRGKLKGVLLRASLKSILLWLFVPVFILCITANLFLTNVLIRRQVRDNALASISELVSQTRYYLDYRLYGIFEQLVLFEQGPDMAAFVANAHEDEARRRQRYVRIFTELEQIYNNSFSMLDSVFVAVERGSNPADIFQRFYYPPYRSDFSFSLVMNGEPLIRQGEKSYRWLNLHQNEINPNRYTDNRVASLYKVAGDEGSASRYFILFNFRNDFFRQIFGDIKVAEEGCLALLGDGEVMSFQGKDKPSPLTGELLTAIEDDPRNAGTMTWQGRDGGKMFAVWESLQLGHWKLAAIFPDRGLLRSVDKIRLIMTACSLAAIGVALILSLLIIRVISTPISRWVSKLRSLSSEVSGEVSRVLLDDVICAEIAELNRGITHLVNQVRQLEHKKRELQIRVLHEQMKPHFLYNALFSIEQLGGLGEYEKMTDIIRSLNGFYRLSLSKGRDIIPLKDELAHAEYYLNIQMIRSKRVSYAAEVDPSFMEVKIVKLSLQPLLENAIFHAMKHDEDLHLKISARGAPGGVRISVEDDGIGMAEDRLEKFHRALETGDWSSLPEVYGIRNVHERILLHYGPPCGLSITSVFEGGTTVSILVPRGGGEGGASHG
jgi:two-component system sensor histidine kinase YesM